MIGIASPSLGRRERDAAAEVIESGQLADGPVVRAFEREFAETVGTEYGVATSNGTTALHAVLHAFGIGRGDRVVTTPFSFVATANAIRFCGAEPVFVDIDPQTLNVDPDAVAAVVEREAVDAVLVVHLYGLPVEMDRLREIADRASIPLIEDAAQAHGATYGGVPVGALGDAACFSFYPTKNMTTGEGGMITTDDREVAERAARFVNHGRSDSYVHVELGHNFRMTSIAAAIGRVQLGRLDGFLSARRENASRLTEALERTDLVPPATPDGARHAYHQYTLRTRSRERLEAYLAERGIGSGVYYPTPIHRQPAYAHMDRNRTFPVAERAADEVLSVPVHPNLTEAEGETVATALAGYEHE
jgi:dTDP-4-amino-4,6-dideoxygalactose transaminase